MWFSLWCELDAEVHDSLCSCCDKSVSPAAVAFASLYSAVIMLEHTSMYFGGVPSICEDDTSLYPDFYNAGYVNEIYYSFL